MLKIGTFSQLTGVTVKALRYYDRVGLLKPAEVDRFSGYRYYTAAQIDRLNRILALKDLGLSLEEIGQVLDAHISAAELRGMLRLKAVQLRHSIAEEQARLDRVAARLRLIDRDDALAAEVVVRQIPAQQLLSYREVIAGPWQIKPLFARVAAAIETHRIIPAGPGLALYHHGEYREHDLDIEVAFPVLPDGPHRLTLDHERVMRRTTLPAVQVATTICRMQAQVDVFTANRDLCIWIAENGYRISDGPCREVYVETPVPGEPLIFEVQLPVEEA
ncbi:MAG: MerR family transcriptional regulator [Oscillochloris sp.]|nr:MerR family transcriptional regulator [Oscillochloris sp.]